MTGSDTDTTDRLRPLRRTVLRAIGALGATAGLSGVGAAESHDSDPAVTGSSTAASPAMQRMRRRVSAELENRIAYSRTQLMDEGEMAVHESNGRLSDDAVVSKFGKALVHDERTGLPTADAYDALVDACMSGEGFDGIPLHPLSTSDSRDGIVEAIDPAPVVDDKANFSPRPLVQPETAWSYTTEGKSYAQLEIARPPAFDSQQTGAEMVELYWRALTRDVPFHDYDRGEREAIADAISELGHIEGYHGPGSAADPNSDRLTTNNLFRGVTPGSQTGPYVSQFLWKDLDLGARTVDQTLRPPVAESTPREYMTDIEDWLKVQKGVAPSLDRNLPSNEFGAEPRYIITGRDLAERVHDDPPFRQLQKATQVLVFGTQAPLDESIPYTLPPFETQDPFGFAFTEAADNPNSRDEPSPRNVDSFFSQTTMPFNDFGPLYLEKKVLEATEHGQKAAWHKKWNVHRRLRPEEYAGRVHAVRTSDLSTAADYPIPDNLLQSEAIDETLSRHGSFLLPQAYAEGSPTHPSYPAGHSVVAGAGATVLKALFDEDYVFKAREKVFPTEDGSDLRNAADVSNTSTLAHEHDIFAPLTVGGELNKLASNMALGRNWAGIHYRTDGIEGLRLGEAAAIQYLEDQLTLPQGEPVELSFESFDGEPLTVTPTSTGSEGGS